LHWFWCGVCTGRCVVCTGVIRARVHGLHGWEVDPVTIGMPAFLRTAAAAFDDQFAEGHEFLARRNDGPPGAVGPEANIGGPRIRSAGIVRPVGDGEEDKAGDPVGLAVAENRVDGEDAHAGAPGYPRCSGVPILPSGRAPAPAPLSFPRERRARGPFRGTCFATAFSGVGNLTGSEGRGVRWAGSCGMVMQVFLIRLV